MEEKKTVKKSSGFKATVRRLWRKFLAFTKRKYNQFMALPKHIRIITYVWVVIILLILIIILGSISNNKFQKQHKEMEERIAKVAVTYAQDNLIYGSSDNKERIDIEALIDNSYINRDEFADKTCKGFVVLSYDEEAEKVAAKTYLNCKKYTTKGYKKLVESDKD